MTNPKKSISPDELKAALLGALPELLREWLPAGELRDGKYVALNPNRDDRTLGSFQIDLATGEWVDHAIGKQGSDAISLHAYLFNHNNNKASWRELLGHQKVLDRAVIGCAPPPANSAKKLKEKKAAAARAKRVYDAASDIKGHPAEVYLTEVRGLKPNKAWRRLRASLLPFKGFGLCPTLLAPHETPDGTVVGLQRIYLQHSGQKLRTANPKRSLGAVRGNPIKLGDADHTLVLCEGLEDGLTILQEFGQPVWVAGGTSFLSGFAIPPSVKRLIIASDNDDAGQAAAISAAEHYAFGCIDVRIARPDPRFKDFNDQLRSNAR